LDFFFLPRPSPRPFYFLHRFSGSAGHSSPSPIPFLAGPAGGSCFFFPLPALALAPPPSTPAFSRARPGPPSKPTPFSLLFFSPFFFPFNRRSFAADQSLILPFFPIDRLAGPDRFFFFPPPLSPRFSGTNIPSVRRFSAGWRHTTLFLHVRFFPGARRLAPMELFPPPPPFFVGWPLFFFFFFLPSSASEHTITTPFPFPFPEMFLSNTSR